MGSTVAGRVEPTGHPGWSLTGKRLLSPHTTQIRAAQYFLNLAARVRGHSKDITLLMAASCAFLYALSKTFNMVSEGNSSIEL